MKDGQVKLDFRGGRREGSGRKSKGVTKKISVTLPPEGWERIEREIELGNVKSYSQFFRQSMGFYED